MDNQVNIQDLRQKAREGTLTKEDTRLAVALLRGSREAAEAPAVAKARAKKLKAETPKIDTQGVLDFLKGS